MTVQDENGATCSDIVAFHVTTPPSVQVLTPSNGSIVNEGELLTFEGTVQDAEDEAELLNLEWRLSNGDVLYTHNANSLGETSFSTSTLAAGTYAIELFVTDTAGFSSVSSSVFTVNALPSLPTVEINPQSPGTMSDLVASAQGSICGLAQTRPTLGVTNPSP